MLLKEKIDQYYKTYSKELFYYLIKLTGSSESAEDLLHDLFVNLIDYSLTRTINEKTVRSFLYRAAHNLALNHIRKNRKTDIVDIDVMEQIPEKPGNEETISRINEEEIKERIYRFLDTVSPRDRSIFILHKESGLNYADIADILNISDRTVRRSISSLLDKMYDILENEGFLQ
jgi:RNA polymerase sigma factor (sigma-70 family)